MTTSQNPHPRHRIALAIRRPRRLGRQDEPRQGDEYVVVVDPPAGEVAPRLVAVFLQGEAVRQQLVVDLVVLLARDADGIAGFRVVAMGDAECLGDAPQAQVAGPDAQLSAWFAG